MSKKITTIGGQALMEGIMMVGPQRTVAAFCDEQGNISTEEITAPRLTKQYPLLGKPFIRGIFALVDSFRMGYKALSLSADKLTEGEEEEELSGLDKWLNDHLGEKLTAALMGVASVLGIALAVVLFFLLPTVLFNLLEGVVPVDIAGWRSIFEGVLRIGIFVAYVVLISLVPDIKRTFQYHGEWKPPQGTRPCWRKSFWGWTGRAWPSTGRRNPPRSRRPLSCRGYRSAAPAVLCSTFWASGNSWGSPWP